MFPAGFNDTNPVIRVVVADMSEVHVRLLSDQINQHPKMRVSAVTQTTVGLLRAVNRTTDVLLLGAHVIHPPPGILSHLFAEYASLRVLVMSVRDNMMGAYWLQVTHHPLVIEGAASVTDHILWLYQLDLMSY